MKFREREKKKSALIYALCLSQISSIIKVLTQNSRVFPGFKKPKYKFQAFQGFQGAVGTLYHSYGPL